MQKYIISSLIVASVFAGIFFFHSSAHAACTGPVTLYRDGSYLGAVSGFGPGEYTLFQLSQVCNVLQNSASSIKVAPGYRAILYDLDNFSGASLVVTSNISSLSTVGWNDRVTSMRVELIAPSPPPPPPPPPP
ncbi:MAG: hypothetical protein HY445_02575, partial [Candidatus Niyogibacteria bacterium]|nr:hypothetical protein [Candidatus Niyogibacteria bacterium]